MSTKNDHPRFDLRVSVPKTPYINCLRVGDTSPRLVFPFLPQLNGRLVGRVCPFFFCSQYKLHSYCVKTPSHSVRQRVDSVSESPLQPLLLELHFQK